MAGKSTGTVEVTLPPSGSTAITIAAPLDAGHLGSGAEGEDGAVGDPQAVTTQVNDITLPSFEIHSAERDGVLMDRANASSATAAHPLSGIWEQVAGPDEADFAPGGFIRSVLMINPAMKAAAIYRVFRGDIALVVGGEFALDWTVDAENHFSGSLDLRPDPSQNSRFRTEPLSLGGTPEIVMTPPATQGSWNAQWVRNGVELTINGTRYAAITRDAFETLRRGGGDVASEADKNERIPERSAKARADHVNETSFFGVKGGGKRVCFVVDISGSMAGPKLDRLKRELSSTISGLSKSVMFSVAFFDGAPHVMDQAWMKGPADVSRALALIAQQSIGGGTDPTGAFQFAFTNLSPLPDCIYFMTDGLIPPTIPSLLKQLNVGKTPTIIHTIALGEAQAAAIMQQIASENSGTYLFITP